ncbi:hypothetical protein IY145_01555 [Methylosinus sp. H3A]|uniref:hypothetical protein n=1 Tax=Methylosinus sp. H3A TaxID=2785786 RepID=UPI0018C23C28|nr:hypothetical protein [Methylosinus sp. H3A]MBG0808101.1 hypothetical protein [Methylosinus sp. H3A]
MNAEVIIFRARVTDISRRDPTSGTLERSVGGNLLNLNKRINAFNVRRSASAADAPP